VRAVFRAWCGVEAAGGDAAVLGVRWVRSGGVPKVRGDRKVTLDTVCPVMALSYRDARDLAMEYGASSVEADRLAAGRQ